MVEPILLYGCEIWGFENLKVLEQVHLMFCKPILKVRFTTPNYMVYGELGRFPLEITIKIRMTSFWRNLIYGDKLSSCMYKLLFSLKQNGVYTFKWLNFIESIFNDTGMGYVFANQDDSDYKLLLESNFYKINIFKNGTMTCSYLLEENVIQPLKKIFVLKSI